MGTQIVINTTTDFSLQSLSTVDTLHFVTSGFTVASFVSSQFDNSQIVDALNVIGDPNFSQINVTMAAGGTFSSAAWIFTTWSSPDVLNVIGSVAADTITAPSPRTLIDGNQGADHLTGGASNDVFHYNQTTDVEAGEQIDGGDGVGDRLELSGGGTLDFRGAAIANIEQINFTGLTTTAGRFSGSQLGAALIQAVSGFDGVDVLILDGAATNLGTVLFSNWTNGVDSIILLGTVGRDVLIGSDQDDTLRAGRGRDVLIGGAANDVFVFNTALNTTTNVDRIVDFSVPSDTIDLENAIFHGLAAGRLAARAFFKGAAAHDANDHIIYNPATGAVFYDSNGNLAGGAVKFAQLAAHLALTNADFLVI